MPNKKELLKDISDPSQYFYLNTGSALKNLNELSTALTSMDPQVFKYHVNADKNDFANWINDIIRDESLAKSIRKVKTSATMAKKVAARIKTLKKS